MATSRCVSRARRRRLSHLPRPSHRPPDPFAHMTAVRTRRHLLTVAHGLGQGELYDLEADPSARRNLWADPACREVKVEMLLRMTDRMAFTCDPLPARRGLF